MRPDAMSSADDGDLVDDPPPAAPIPAFESRPFRPVRSAMRDEAGRRIVGGVVGLGETLLPGLLVAGGAAWLGSRIAGGLRAKMEAFRRWRQGDETIEVKVVHLKPQMGARSRFVDAPADDAGASPPAPAPPRASSRAARRARLLRERGRA
jgi:hypothetical protein